MLMATSIHFREERSGAMKTARNHTPAITGAAKIRTIPKKLRNAQGIRMGKSKSPKAFMATLSISMKGPCDEATSRVASFGCTQSQLYEGIGYPVNAKSTAALERKDQNLREEREK